MAVQSFGVDGVVYITILEAGELALRDHELGTCGSVVVEAFIDGKATGAVTTAQPSFPRPCWGEVLQVRLGSRDRAAELSLVVLDADPLQPRAGPPFCFGFLRLSLSPSSFGSHHRRELEFSPGRQGYLTFEVSRTKPPGGRPGSGERRPWDAAAKVPPSGVEFCGVLCVAPGPKLPSGSWAFEASAGACAFASWEVQVSHRGVGDDSPLPHFGSSPSGQPQPPLILSQMPQRLFVMEHDPTLSVHATLVDTDVDDVAVGASAKVEVHLSRVEGPHGLCNALLEARPAPLSLLWKSSNLASRDRPQLHLRFFQTDFLRPGRQSGLCIRITLLAAPEMLPLPLGIHVPAGCFSRADGQEDEEATFAISRLGDCTEICLIDPLRLVGRSVWRITSGFAIDPPVVANPAAPELSECLIDLLALRLHLDGDKTLTLPVGGSLVVVRVALAALQVDVARPVLGVFVPDVAKSEELHVQPAVSRGEVVGLVVHALAVHSPVVTQCLLSAGPEAGTLFDPLPHHGRRAFVPAQPSRLGRLVVHAFLPEHGVAAHSEVHVSDGPLQILWKFPTPSGEVHAAALVTFARWPSDAGCLASARFCLRVLRTRISEHLLPQVAPAHFSLGVSAENQEFRWSGQERADHEALLASSGADEGFGYLAVRCGAGRLANEFFLPDLVAAQTGLAMVGRRAAGGADGDESESVDAAPGLSLPVLVETSVGDQRVAAFYFLPVLIQRVADGPQPRLAPGSSLQGVDKGDVGGAPGDQHVAAVVFVQEFSAFVALGLDAHAPSCTARQAQQQRYGAAARAVWEPLPALAVTAGSQRAAGRARAQVVRAAASGLGCAASWAPRPAPGAAFGACVEQPPHIVRVLCSDRDASISEGHLNLQIEFEIGCAACGASVSLLATPRAPLHVADLPPWQPFDVHFTVRQADTHLAKEGAAACARIMFCPSQLCRQPVGLLTLQLKPWVQGGPGIAELLEIESAAAERGLRGPAAAGSAGRTGLAVALRLSVDSGAMSGQALVLDGREDGVASAALNRQQLALEIAPGDAMRSVTLEVQEFSGARRLLASVALAALGPVGDCRAVAYPLHFTSRCSMVLVASYEARRHRVSLSQPAAAAVQEDLPVAKRPSPSAAEEQRRALAAEISRVRGLAPAWTAEASFDPAEDRAAGRGGARGSLREPQKASRSSVSPRRPRSASAAAGARQQQHPFLERGKHHWLAPQDAWELGAKKPGKMWCQEMGRKQPVTSLAAAATSTAIRKPPGWDVALEAAQGPEYRLAFLRKQREVVWDLQEQLARSRVEVQRTEQRLAQLRKYLAAAQKELARSPVPGTVEVRGSSGADRLATSGSKAAFSRELLSEQGVEQAAQQVCSRCSANVPHGSRFCAGCMPSILDEALKLRADAGAMIAERSALRHRIAAQTKEADILEARQADLEAQSFAISSGARDSGHDPERTAVLALLTQLRSLQRDFEARSALDEERLQVMTQREKMSEDTLKKATKSLTEAKDIHSELTSRLGRGEQLEKKILSSSKQAN